MNPNISFRIFVLAATALVSGCSITQAEIATNLYLVIPGSNWSLEIDAPGFIFQQKEITADGMNTRLEAENKSDGFFLSAFLEKAEGVGDAKQCREYYWNRARQSPFKKDDIKMSEIGSVALVEYIVKEPINSKNMNAYLSQYGYWVDVHISKADFKPEDEAKFQSIVKSIRFNNHFVPSTLELASWGSSFMLKRNYAEAIRCDEKAWETEQIKPTLSHRQQIYLLSDLIDANGNSGNLERARELTEMGLQKEPGYPKFSYDLACYYAELGDKTQALENLKKAVENRTQLFLDDRLPNPATDSSFSKYSKDPDFVKVFAEWNK